MMKASVFVIMLCFVVTLFPCIGYDLAYGQSESQEQSGIAAKRISEESAETEDAEEESAEKSTMTTLSSILQSMKVLEREIKNKEREYRSARTKEEKADVENDISTLREKLNSHERDFEEISTGVDLELFDEVIGKELDWAKEVQELLAPIIKELKSVTERPRHLERLRSEMAHAQTRIPVIKKAIENLEHISSRTQDRNIKKALKELKKGWVIREQEINNQLKVTQHQLDELSKEKRSFLESAQDILRIFFKSRGRNLVLAFAAFLCTFLLFHLTHRLIRKFSPIHNAKSRPFYVRVADIMYHFMTIIGSVCALLIMLYISDDWVLMSFVVILIAGIIWGAKKEIPRFWEQIKILMNLGAVRENEKIVYNGIPWKVVSLNIYTYLENPKLSMGKLRLPLRDLSDMTSRPYHPDEPWFPTRVNDWVLLADGTYGKVVVQTPEMVQLVLKGGSYKTYPTEAFLGLNPNNISRNFRIKVVFGVDYEHQQISTTEIPEKMTKMLIEKLSEAGYKDSIVNINVEFNEAGGSSLDLIVLADFSGKAATYYNRLTRAIQRFCVDTCNHYGWGIPFPQLTVHAPDFSKKD